MSLTGIPELKESYRALGAARFLLLMIGLLTYIGGFAALMIATDHPQSAGSTCRRKCMIEAYWFSPHLLGGGAIEWLAFAWLWSLPAFVIGFVIYARLKRRREPLSNPVELE